MVHVFLTSSPTGSLDDSHVVDGIDRWNGFDKRLRVVWPERARCLMIASAPDNYGMMDEMTGYFWHTWLREGYSMECMDKLDYRWNGGNISRQELHGYDVIFLAGGHVPTQRNFFEQIRLREKLQGFQGVIIGISAGSMNSADMVYIQPEEDGEAIDADFVRWGRGLNLTKRNVIPHYQMVKNRILDGMRLYEDVTYPDSTGHEFVVMCDGSYLYAVANSAGEAPHQETVCGESYLIKDGKLYDLCGHEEKRELI